MEAVRLTLSHFRSYTHFDIALSGGTTLIVGNNAAGKTNILEALYCLATTKSFRAELDREMIAWGQANANIAGVVKRRDQDLTLRILLMRQDSQQTKKQVWINGVPKRAVDYFGSVAVLVFLPADVELSTSSPAVRRRHLDLFLAQADREYKRALTAYGHILSQRNKLLESIRDREAREDELTYWDHALLGEAATIHSARQTLFAFLAEHPQDLGPIIFVYQPRHINEAELARLRSRDIAAGQTTAGPHRDDFCFLQAGRDLSRFGSRGEQRTAVLALKLGELAFMTQRLGEPPVLLLDDIFSELDHAHREHIVHVLPKQQTIMTTTDIHLVDKRFLERYEVITL